MANFAFTGVELDGLEVHEGLFEIIAEFDEIICIRSHRVCSASVYNLSEWKQPRNGMKPKVKHEFFVLQPGYKITSLKRFPSAYTLFAGGHTSHAPVKHVIAHVSPERAGVVLAQWTLEPGVDSCEFSVCPATGRVCVPDRMNGFIYVYDKLGFKQKVVRLPAVLNFHPAAGQFKAMFGRDRSFIVLSPMSGGQHPAVLVTSGISMLPCDDQISEVGQQQTFAAANGNRLKVCLLEKPHMLLTTAFLGTNAPSVDGKPSRYYYECSVFDDRFYTTRSFSLAAVRPLQTSHIRCDVRAGYLLSMAAGGRIIYYDIRDI